MIHNIAIIDDGIPLDQSGSVDPSQRMTPTDLKLLAKENWGSETSLKSLIEELLKKEGWKVSGFKHPNLYFNAIGDEYYHPDVIIYDWEFLNSDEKPEDLLFKILDTTFCVIGIYSGAEKMDEIKTTLENKRFDTFRKRVEPLDKRAIDSHTLVFDKILKMYETNFAFKYGHEIINNILVATDKVLVELGKMELIDAFSLLGEGEDLREFVVEKIRNRLESIDLTTTIAPSSASDTTVANDIAKKLWSYRLYYKPNDNLVRRGDIILKKENGIDNYDVLYVVLNADCDLQHFWNKNFGSINLVEIHRATDKYTIVKDRLNYTWKSGDQKTKTDVSSLTNKIFKDSDDLLALFFIRINDNDLMSYILFPKDIKTEKIKPPRELLEEVDTKKKKNIKLKYDHWDNVTRLVTISEPFRTPLVQHILSSISGYGVPDYQFDPLKEEIAKQFPGLC